MRKISLQNEQIFALIVKVLSRIKRSPIRFEVPSFLSLTLALKKKDNTFIKIQVTLHANCVEVGFP